MMQSNLGMVIKMGVTGVFIVFLVNSQYEVFTVTRYTAPIAVIVGIILALIVLSLFYAVECSIEKKVMERIRNKKCKQQSDESAILSKSEHH